MLYGNTRGTPVPESIDFTVGHCQVYTVVDEAPNQKLQIMRQTCKNRTQILLAAQSLYGSNVPTASHKPAHTPELPKQHQCALALVVSRRRNDTNSCPLLAHRQCNGRRPQFHGAG